MPENHPAPSVPSPASGRRGFFGEALREMMGPVAGILEKRIAPVLNVLEAIPGEGDRLSTNSIGGSLGSLLDQPDPRRLALPQAGGGTVKALPERYLRPPGAMAPGEFEQVCSKCGYCVEACPASAIRLDKGDLAGDGFPYIVPLDQPCVVCESLACMKSCPSGALKLVDRLAIRMGTAAVDSLLCLRNSGEACTLCLDVCPVMGEEGGLAALVISPDSGRVRVRKNVCIGCGLCESRCPTSPPAITITPARNDEDIIIA